MAEELPDDDRRMPALIILGTSRALNGDAGGLLNLEQAITTARQASSFELVIGLLNLSSARLHLGDARGACALLDEAESAARRLGHGLGLRWTAVARITEAYWTGRWDDSLERVDAFTAQGGAVRFLLPLCQAFAAWIRLARGETEAALGELDAMLAAARTQGVPSLGSRCSPRVGRSSQASGDRTRQLRWPMKSSGSSVERYRPSAEPSFQR